MQAERRKNERYERARRFVHVALTREAFADPIAQRTALRHAAPHIRKSAATHQDVIFRSEHEEGIGRIESCLLLVTLDAATKSALGQLIARPDRLPRREKGPTFSAQS